MTRRSPNRKLVAVLAALAVVAVIAVMAYQLGHDTASPDPSATGTSSTRTPPGPHRPQHRDRRRLGPRSLGCRRARPEPVKADG